MEIASSIWKELKDWFYHSDVFIISDIQEEICTLKQGDLYISSYNTKLKIFFLELDNFRPILACECDISCITVDKIWSYQDYDQFIKFLKRLNDQYSAVRSHIMLMDPLPNIFKVYSLLVKQQRQIVSLIDESKLLPFPTG